MTTFWRGFFEAVEEMRKSQIIYFRIRSPSALKVAKEWEAMVDAVIKMARLSSIFTQDIENP